MSMQHTPGPWFVIERRHPYKDGSKEHIERNIYTEWKHPQLKDNYPVVCQSFGVGMDGENAVRFVNISEANARLIAAAPDLLEALKAIVKSLAYQDEEGLIEHAQQMIDARSAIAKATGEQS